MRTSRVHVEADLVVGDKLTFDKDRGHYLKHVLRLKPGAAVALFNGDGHDYAATLSLEGKTLLATIETAIAVNTEATTHTTIVQAIGKADHLDWMIQKSTELGVTQIQLFNAEHTQHQIKTAQRDKKLAHWRGVAISACEQSGRAQVPEILFHSNLLEALAESKAELKLVLDFGGEPIASFSVHAPASLAILTGPEGGFSKTELESAKQAEFKTASMGPRVLRFETATIAALTVFQASGGALS